MGKVTARPFKKTCPCTILPPTFLIFEIAPTLGEVIKIYSPPPTPHPPCGDPNYDFSLARLVSI